MRLLYSRTLTITILLLFLSLCVVGTLIPHEGVEPARIVREWQGNHPTFALLGLTHLFSTGYFAVVVGLVWLNILVSSIRLIQRLTTSAVADAGAVSVAEVANLQTKAVIPAIINAEMLKKICPLTRFRVNADGNVFRGERLRFSRWAVVAFHFSLLFIITGVLLNRATFYRGVYSLIEKDYFIAGKEQPVSLEEGFWFSGKLQPTRVVLKIVNDSYEQPGYQPSLASEIRAESASEKREFLVTRAEPIRFNVLMIYQSPQYGYAPVFTRITPDGAERTGTIRMTKAENGGDQNIRLFTGNAVVPASVVRIEARFEAPPGFVGIPDEVGVSFLGGGNVLASGTMAPGDTLSIGEDRYRLEEIRFWTDLIVSRQPWLFLLYLGFLGGFCSLAAYALFNPCTIYGVIDFEKGVTTVAIQCLRYRSAEKSMLQRLVARLQNPDPPGARRVNLPNGGKFNEE